MTPGAGTDPLAAAPSEDVETEQLMADLSQQAIHERGHDLPREVRATRARKLGEGAPRIRYPAPSDVATCARCGRTILRGHEHWTALDPDGQRCGTDGEHVPGGAK